MKATKLILGIGMITLTAIAFGQFERIADRLFPERSEHVYHFTAEYNYNDHTRIDDWMYDLHSWASEKISRNVEVAPEVYILIVSDRVDLVISPFEAGVNENEMVVESWMTAPFATGLVEESLEVESWMTAPFATGLVEESLEVESWMTRPFGNNVKEEEITIEPWMTAPFGYAIAKENIELESWMMSPFGLHEQQDVENWMLSAWT